jgi:hypothetical protein
MNGLPSAKHGSLAAGELDAWNRAGVPYGRSASVEQAPDDEPAFKAWLQAIAQRVAEAAEEGGFLGFGGVQVSDAEKATLAEISGALKLTA